MARKILVDVHDVATYLALPEGSVRKLVQRRTIPFIKIGRTLRFDLNAIDEWLDEHTDQR